MRLVRNDGFAGGCAGRLWLRAAGKVRRARFDFGRVQPSEGGERTQVVRMTLAKRVRRAVAKRPRRARVETRAYQAYGHRAGFRLRTR